MSAPAASVIRRARAADAAGLLALEAHFPGDRFSAASIRRLLRSPSAAVWVAGKASLLGAIVLLTRRGSRSGRIYSLVVHPQARGQGLGQALVQVAERHARRNKLDAISLEVRVDNAQARALYARLDYRVAGHLPAYYDDACDGLRLRKTLSRRDPPRP